MPALIPRTLILACWLLALVVHGEVRASTVAVAGALVTVWALALVRDLRRASYRLGAGPAPDVAAG